MSSAKYVGFLGGANKFGRWIPEQEIKARAVAGGATIDFSQALFVHPVITIRATAFWGGVSLIVPPNVLVQQNGRAILGGFGDGGGVYHSSSGPVAETVSNSGVMIKIVGTAVMGSVSAMVNRKARPAELLTPEEAAAKMQEAAEPSTTRQDIREQVLGDVFAARAAAAPPVPPALQQALQAQAAAQHAAAQPQMQAQAVPVVQGVPVSGAKA